MISGKLRAGGKRERDDCPSHLVALMDTPHDSLAEQPPYPLPGTITTTFAPGPTLSEVPLPPSAPLPAGAAATHSVAGPLVCRHLLDHLLGGQRAEHSDHEPRLREPVVSEPSRHCRWRGAFRRWHDGLVYMAAVMGILLAHEMGHFSRPCATACRPACPSSFPCR